jgi:hypothetical protein
VRFLVKSEVDILNVISSDVYFSRYKSPSNDASLGGLVVTGSVRTSFLQFQGRRQCAERNSLEQALSQVLEVFPRDLPILV